MERDAKLTGVEQDLESGRTCLPLWCLDTVAKMMMMMIVTAMLNNLRSLRGLTVENACHYMFRNINYTKTEPTHQLVYAILLF